MFWQGRDNAEKIKYFIKQSYEEWGIKYVMLVGGRKDQTKTETWWTPVRYSHLNRPYLPYNEGRFLTDLYFADIYDQEGKFSNWDTDNDGVFGEWNLNSSADDRPDLYPDVFVGRLTCRNIFDVKVIVNKIINYEKQKASDSWFKKLLVIAGDTYPEKTPDFIDGENHTQRAIDLMTGFEPVKLWASDGSLKNWVDIVKGINQGAGFVFFSGHGGPHTWVTYDVKDSEKTVGSFRLRHMFFLRNFNKLPVCLSASGCFNNMFNVSVTDSDWVYMHILGIPIKYNVPKCWGESLVMKPFGGSIAVIASTAFSYESSDNDDNKGGCEWLDIHFFEQYSKNNITILGECWGETVNSFLQNFTINWEDTSVTGDAIVLKNLEQWVVLGDPSLKIGGYGN